MTHSRQDAMDAVKNARRTVQLARRDPDLANSRVGAMVALSTLMEAFEVLDRAGQFDDLDAVARLDEQLSTLQQERAEHLARQRVSVSPDEIQRTREEISGYIARQEAAGWLSREVANPAATAAEEIGIVEPFEPSVGELPVDSFNTFRPGGLPSIETDDSYRHRYDRSGLPAEIQHSAFVPVFD